MFSRQTDQPLAQGFFWVKAPGGRVDWEEKPRTDNYTILLEKRPFHKATDGACG
jgi:hypothetical protein